MAYCSQDDLVKMISLTELAELTAESGNEPDAVVVAEAIVKAAGEIDSYLAMRYVLPLAATPPQVQSLAVDMALYHLYSRRSVAPKVRQQKYDAAVAFLKEVAAGQALVEGAGEPSGDNREVGEFSGASRVLGRDGLSEW
jgi:phage gp36-like protein